MNGLREDSVSIVEEVDQEYCDDRKKSKLNACPDLVVGISATVQRLPICFSSQLTIRLVIMSGIQTS
jgi:hypothetical protein